MSSTSLQHVPGSGPAVLTAAEEAVTLPGTFNRDQLDLLKRTVADGTSDDEFALFTEVCKSTGLNPFQRQIYAIMRQESFKSPSGRWEKRPKMTIQTGIDGYRLIAARTGVHAGTSDATYGPTDADGYPEWATIVVRKLMPGGVVAEFVGTARWAEYVQAKDEYQNGQKTGRSAPSGQWPKMPFLMIGKCAEALALRRAFPAELSGVYTNEEMSQAGPVEDADVVAAPRRGETPRAPDRGASTRAVEFEGKELWTGEAPAKPEPAPAAPDYATQAEVMRELLPALDEAFTAHEAGGDREATREAVERLLTAVGDSWSPKARGFALDVLSGVCHGQTVQQSIADTKAAAASSVSP